MRGLPPGHKDKPVEDLVAKMQRKHQFNGPYTDTIYMRIPVYAKPTVKKLLQVNRMPEPVNIKCIKQAEMWMQICFERLCYFRKKSGGPKGRNPNKDWKHAIIYRRHSAQNQGDWFRANLLHSVYTSFACKAKHLIQIEACKHCNHG